jgi:hypothetical protein
MKIKKIIGLALLSFFTIGQSANASLVTIDDMGSAFTLSYESTSIGLFGMPSLSNGTISFSPSSFAAQSTGPSFTDITNSTFVMTLNIKNGYQFNNISLVERGDYFLNNASVDVGGQIRVHDTANVIASEATDFITETSGAYISDSNFHNWEATAGINKSDSDWYKGKELTLTLENVLIAQALGFPDLAFIEKKLVALEITTVPLPAASMFLILSLLSLLPATRKRLA